MNNKLIIIIISDLRFNIQIFDKSSYKDSLSVTRTSPTLCTINHILSYHSSSKITSMLISKVVNDKKVLINPIIHIL